MAKQSLRQVRKLTLELSRQKVREQALKKFKYIRTCMLARELCLLIRSNRAVLNKEDVKTCCSFVSKLCREAGCKEASELCVKAAEAIMENEQEYLELCEQSCKKCSEFRQPSRRAPERITYVA